MAKTTHSPSPRAQEFAHLMIRNHGHRYPDRIVIPLSQRELARRYDLSPGTLGWYLNELGDQVITRRPHLTLRLIDIVVTPPPPPPAEASALVEAGAQESEELIEAIECNNELLRLILDELRPRDDRANDSRDRATGVRQRPKSSNCWNR